MAVEPELSGDVVVAVDGDGAFLLDVPTGRYFGLNPAGLIVWRALEEGSDPMEALRPAFPDVDADVLRADTDVLLERLGEAGLLRVPPAG